jgi:hypothetical protein
VSLEGGDAWLLRQTGNDMVTGLRRPEDVAEGLLAFWRLWQRGALGSTVRNVENLDRFDRRHRSRELAGVFDQVLREHQSQGT